MTDNAVTWTKSSWSQTDWQKQCVEIGAPAGDRARLLRDSVHPSSAVLALAPAEFAALLAGARTGAL